MKQVTEITNEPKQRLEITTETGESFEFKLEYSDQQQGWFWSLTYGDTTINGSRLVTHPNILRSYKNIFPFGISIQTDDFSEPILIDDFETERVKFYLLTASEVEIIEKETSLIVTGKQKERYSYSSLRY